MKVQLTKAQQASLSADRNIMVLAGAGTGKTRALTERVLYLLTSKKVRPGELLVLTFTRKAASEMKERIYNRLLEAYFNNNNDSHLQNAVYNFNKMVINTFHGFFASLLKDYGYTIGIDHQFKVMEEDYEQQLLIQKSFQEMLKKWGKEKQDELTSLFTYYNYSDLKNVSNAILEDWPSFKETVDFYQELNLWDGDQLNISDFMNVFFIEPDIDYTSLSDLLKQILKDTNTFVQNLTNSKSAYIAVLKTIIPSLLEKLNSTGEPREQIKIIYNTLTRIVTNERETPLFTKKDGLLSLRGPKGLKETFKIYNKSLEKKINQYGLQPDQIRDYFLYDENSILNSDYFKIFSLWLKWGNELIAIYEKLKYKYNYLDFHDLEMLSKKLFLSAPQIVEKLKNQFRYVMVDEFQDTNSLQWDLLYRIVSDGEGLEKDKLFIVGDKKQAIYGFRGGEVEICDLAEEIIQKTNELNRKHHTPLESIPETEQLQDYQKGIIPFVENFRSDTSLLEFFNAFGQILFPDKNPQPFDTIYHALKPGVEQKKKDGIKVFYGIYSSENKENNNNNNKTKEISASEKREIEAQSIAQFLRWVYDEKWEELADFLGLKPEEVRHNLLWLSQSMQQGKKSVGILFRRKTYLAVYERALIKFGLPFKMESGQSLFQQQEIRDILHLLRWLKDPTDDVSLIGFARSVIWGLSDLFITFLSMMNSSHMQSYFQKMNFIYSFLREESFFQSEEKVISLKNVLGDHWESFAKNLPERVRNLNIKNIVFPVEDWIRFKEGFKHLLELKSMVMTRPLFTLFLEVIQRFRILQLFKNFPDGEQKIANIHEFMDILNNFVVENSTADISSFIKHIENLTESSNIGQGEMDENAVIQVMTVHKSKGLEFPLVILADLEKENQSSSFKKRDILLIEKIMFQELWKDGHGWNFPNLHQHDLEKYNKNKKIPLLLPRSKKIIEGNINYPLEQYLFKKDELREYAEERRLLYVAMTRAQNALMVITGIKSDNFNPEGENTDVQNAKNVALEKSSWKDILLQPFREIDLTNNMFELKKDYTNLPIHSFFIQLMEKDGESGKIDTQEVAEEYIPLPKKRMIEIFHPSELGGTDFNENQEIPLNIPVTEFGTLVHECMEKEYWKKSDDEIKTFLKNREPLLEENEMKELIRHIRKAEKIIKILLKDYPVMYTEIPFYSKIAPSMDKYMKGVIDALLLDSQGKSGIIIDYKTNFTEQPDKEYAHKHGYDLQLAAYSKVVQNIMGIEIKKSILIFTYSGKTVEYSGNELKEHFLRIET